MMTTLTVPFALAVVLALAFPMIYRAVKMRGMAMAINIGEGTHAQALNKLADTAIATRHLLVKFGSDADHAALCGASDIPLGTCPDEPSAAEELHAVLLLGKGGTKKMVASEAITAGEAVFTAANGKIQDLPAGAGTYYQVGFAVTAAGADGDVIEVQDCVPIKTVVS